MKQEYENKVKYLAIWVVMLFFFCIAIDKTLEIPLGPYGILGDIIHKVFNGLFFVTLYKLLTLKE